VKNVPIPRVAVGIVPLAVPHVLAKEAGPPSARRQDKSTCQTSGPESRNFEDILLPQPTAEQTRAFADWEQFAVFAAESPLNARDGFPRVEVDDSAARQHVVLEVARRLAAVKVPCVFIEVHQRTTLALQLAVVEGPLPHHALRLCLVERLALPVQLVIAEGADPPPTLPLLSETEASFPIQLAASELALRPLEVGVRELAFESIRRAGPWVFGDDGEVLSLGLAWV
jgi:hypothetical protein